MAQSNQYNIENFNDRQLILMFHEDQDEHAFSLIVERHGPMVLRVCRKILLIEQDAEDVFQAVFMVLAKKAGSVRWQNCLANWLYGVAYRLSLKANSKMNKRPQSLQLNSDLAVELTESKNEQAKLSVEAERVLYEEIGRLPDKLQGPILLCSLEGKSRQHAAVSLGVKESTVKGRLERARELLHRRLLKRDIVLPVTLLTGGLVAQVAKTGFSTSLKFSPIEVASHLSLDIAVQGNTGAATIQLAQGELAKMLMFTQLKIAAVALVVVMSVGAGGLVLQKSGKGDEPKPVTEKKSLPEIQKQLLGEWEFVSGEFSGKSQPSEMKKNLRMEFTENDVIISSGGKKEKAQYKLDLSHNPNWIDIIKDSSQKTGQKKKVNQSIFEVKGDELKFCLNESPDGDRPKEFSSKTGTVIGYMVLKRIKSGEKTPISDIQKQLVGNWSIVSLEDGARIAPPEFLETAKMIFTKSHLILTEGEKKKGDEYTLDLSKKPIWIDVKINDNNREREKIMMGIIELSGDELKICFNERRDGNRPDEFISEDFGSPNDLYIVAKRIKPTK